MLWIRNSWFTTILVVVVVSCCLCQTLAVKKITSQKEHKSDKKGTIRIAGPWHSDSALDRNVDIGEDAYVKKIISSNEGINFNKDMAEAGEMFEVNGIDDFYDKNAMITYEINGHEIPVHMKPMLTPQTKSLFPEYTKDSPAEMAGFVRGTKGGMMHGYLKKLGGVKLPAGLTLNDLPEYKMQRFTGKSADDWRSLQGLRQEGEFANAVKQNRLLTKVFHKQFPILSEFQRNNRRHHHRNTEALKHNVPRYQRLPERSSMLQHHQNNNLLHEFMQRKPEPVSPHEDKANALFRNIDSLHSKLLLDKQANEAELRSKASQHTDPQKQKAKTRILNLLGELTEKLKGMESVVTAHKEQQVAERFIGGNSESKNEDQTRISNHKSEEFTDQHNNEYVEGRNSAENSQVEAMTRMGEQFKEKVAMLQHGLEEHLQQQPALENKENSGFRNINREESKSYNNDGDAEDASFNNDKGDNVVLRRDNGDNIESTDHNDFLLKSFQRIGSTNDQQPDRNADLIHEVDGQSKHHEMVNGFHGNEEYKPIIMDTKAIDYRPEGDSSEDEQDGNHFGDEEIAEEPINSSSKHRRKFVGKEDDDEDDDEGDGDVRVTSSSRRHWKKPDVDEDEIPTTGSSRNILMKYHKNRHQKEKSVDSEEDEDEMRSSQRHQTQSRHRDEDNDFDDDKMSRRHHHEDDENEDENEDAEVVKPAFHKRKHHNQHLHNIDEDVKSYEDKTEALSEGEHNPKKGKMKGYKEKKENGDEDEGEEESNEKENSKMFEVEESLGDADEKNNIARHRSFRPKAQDDQSDYPDYTEVKDAAIFQTNLLRKKFHAKNLHWSDRLSDRAQNAAETLAGITDLNEKSISRYRVPGENLALISIDSPNVGKDAPDLWARGSQFFDFRSPQLNQKNKDFAQMIWKSENEFGLGVAKSKLGSKWIVTSMFDNPISDRFQDMRLNIESDIPISDPYSDITG